MTVPHPVLTEDLALRLERAAIGWSRAWMRGVEGVELGPFPDHLLVPCHPDRPELDFQNRVNGLTPADAPLVADIVAWYAERGVDPWFELVPTDGFAPLAAALTAAGAGHIGFHGMVYGRPVPASERPPAYSSEVEVLVLARTDVVGFETFGRVRTEAHELPAEVQAQAEADLQGWRDAPGAHLYLALVEGVPAATAALSVSDDGVGYLADAATRPAYRRRGLQSTLIHRRLTDAAAAGCDVVCSQAVFAGSSHRNLQREGLVGGFTKAVWRGTKARGGH